jgi:hypothetical protein
MLIAAFSYGIPAWFDEELNPLINLITRGRPITEIDARQYGVFVYLVLDLPLRLLDAASSIPLPGGQALTVGQFARTPDGGANMAVLADYAGCIALFSVIVACVLMGWRFAGRDPARWLVLILAWSSAVPLLYVVAQHMVDAWQLLFVSASLFLFTGSGRQQRLSGVPLAFATLTKLLPGLLLVYLAVRSWRAAALGAVVVVLLLGVGQVLYGSLMGFGYPLAMLSMGGDTISRWSMHFENNSVRGLLFKVADGYRLEGDTATYLLDQRLVPYLNVLAYALTGGLVAYLLFAAWRGRHQDSVARRSIEFSLALVTMLLVSPHTAQDYLIEALPILAVWLYLWSNGLPRAWGVGQTLLGAAAAVLIGVFVPMNFAARALPIGWLVAVSGNAHNLLFQDQIGSAIGAYDFFGFPGIGLLLGWLLLVRLERQSAHAVVDSRSAYSSSAPPMAGADPSAAAPKNTPSAGYSAQTGSMPFNRQPATAYASAEPPVSGLDESAVGSETPPGEQPAETASTDASASSVPATAGADRSAEGSTTGPAAERGDPPRSSAHVVPPRDEPTDMPPAGSGAPAPRTPSA